MWLPWQTSIIHIIKSKTGLYLVIDKDNYHPIAMKNVISKVLQLLILDYVKDYLYTECNQFGFKMAHSTDMCVFMLKQTVEFYMSRAHQV